MNKNVEIPKKNYVICFLITLFVIVLSTVIFIINNDQKKYSNKVTILRGKVQELKIDAVDEYLQENEKVLLYLGVADDDNSRTLEEKMIPLIEENEFEIIYLNITDVKNRKSFYKSFNKKYSDGIDLKKYPALIFIRDKKVIDIVQREDKELTIMDIRQFLNRIKGDYND